MSLDKPARNKIRTYATLAGILAMTASLFAATSQVASASTLAEVKVDTDKIKKKICFGPFEVEKRIVIGGALGEKLDLKDGKDDGKYVIHLEKGKILCLIIIVDVYAKIVTDGHCLIIRDYASLEIDIRKNDYRLELVDLGVGDEYKLCPISIE